MQLDRREQPLVVRVAGEPSRPHGVVVLPHSQEPRAHRDLSESCASEMKRSSALRSRVSPSARASRAGPLRDSRQSPRGGRAGARPRPSPRASLGSRASSRPSSVSGTKPERGIRPSPAAHPSRPTRPPSRRRGAPGRRAPRALLADHRHEVRPVLLDARLVVHEHEVQVGVGPAGRSRSSAPCGWPPSPRDASRGRPHAPARAPRRRRPRAPPRCRPGGGCAPGCRANRARARWRRARRRRSG